MPLFLITFLKVSQGQSLTSSNSLSIQFANHSQVQTSWTINLICGIWSLFVQLPPQNFLTLCYSSRLEILRRHYSEELYFTLPSKSDLSGFMPEIPRVYSWEFQVERTMKQKTFLLFDVPETSLIWNTYNMSPLSTPFSQLSM